MNKIIKQDLDTIYTCGIDWSKLKNSTVLITGASGLLGSYMMYMLKYLNFYCNLNVNIIVHCRNYLKMKSIIHLFKMEEHITIISGDLLNIKYELDKYKIYNIDYIIHAASPASSKIYGIDPLSVIYANVIITKSLLDISLNYELKGFLFFSSGEVCGKVDKELITEEDYGYLNPMDVRNCYSESKRMGENLCKCYNYQYKVPAVIVRPDHTYGPTIDLKNDDRVFSEFIYNIINNENIIMKSDGSPIRTFNYISDATEGFFRVLLDGRSGECYNISNNDCRISIKDLANLLVSLYPEKNLKVIHKKRDVTNKYLENKNKLCSTLSTKKVETLGYKCKIGIREGFKRTIQSFLS